MTPLERAEPQANGAYLKSVEYTPGLGMDTLVPYLIRVQGNLDAIWLDYFAISIVVSAPPGEPPVSTICLQDSDQASVLGILNSLYDHGFPLLSVEQLEA